MSGLSQVQGTGHGATLWGLLMFPQPLPARTGDQEKIVWRISGSGLLRQMVAIGPDGRRHRLAWGPAFHTGSQLGQARPGVGRWLCVHRSRVLGSARDQGQGDR